MLQGAPSALAACKALLLQVAGRPPAETLAYRVDVLNQVRAGEDGQEGMRAFLERRKPSWVEEGPGARDEGLLTGDGRGGRPPAGTGRWGSVRNDPVDSGS